MLYNMNDSTLICIILKYGIKRHVVSWKLLSNTLLIWNTLLCQDLRRDLINKTFYSIRLHSSHRNAVVTHISWVRRDSSRCGGVNISWAEMETNSQSSLGSCLDIIDLYHELPSNRSFPVNTETKKSASATLEARGIALHYTQVIHQTGLMNRWTAVLDRRSCCEEYSRPPPCLVFTTVRWRWRRGTHTSIHYSPVWALKIAPAASFFSGGVKQGKPKIGRSWHAAAAKCHCVFRSDFSLSCRCTDRHTSLWPS